jgi:O-antigen/teichoic acid export membrane protein
MLSHRRLLTNAAANTLGFIAQVAVSFVMAPITVAALGDDRYGAWSFVESFLAYMLLFDLGVAASLVRFVPRFVASEDRAALNRTYSACLVFFMAVAVVAGLVGWCALTAAADWWLAVPSPLKTELRWVSLIVVAHFALSLPLSVFPAMLDGLHSFVAKSLTRTVFLLLRIPALLAVFRTESPLLNMVFVIAGMNLAESIILAWLVYQRLPTLRFVPGQVDRETIRAVRGYSADAFIAMLAGRLAFSTDAFVIGRILNLAAIGHFGIANRVVDLAKTILRSATTTLTPAVSASEARGDFDAVRAYILLGTRLSLYIVLPIQIGLFVFGRPFLELWMNPAIAAAATPAMWILNLTLSLTIAQSVASRVLYGVGRIRTFSRATLLEGVINVALSAALVGPLGIAGAAWGTTIPHCLCCLFVVVHVTRMLGITPGQYFRRSWAAPLLIAAIPLSIWWPLAAQIEAWTWPRLIACGCAGLVPHGSVVLLLEWQRRRSRVRSTIEVQRSAA